MYEILIAIYAGFAVVMGFLVATVVDDVTIKPTDSANDKTFYRVACAHVSGVFVTMLLVKYGFPLYKVLVLNIFAS